MVRKIMRLEGLAIFLAATLAYFFRAGGPWWLYLLLLLAPDLSMVGYVKGPRLGALTYNLVHNDVVALALLVAGIVAGAGVPVWLGLILLAHLGMDHALGFGLKYPSRFQDTHLQRV